MRAKTRPTQPSAAAGAEPATILVFFELSQADCHLPGFGIDHLSPLIGLIIALIHSKIQKKRR